MDKHKLNTRMKIMHHNNSINNQHNEKPLKPSTIIKLIKEPDNKYDTEAIACEMSYFSKIRYNTNSTNTMIKNCMNSRRVFGNIKSSSFLFIKTIVSQTNLYILYINPNHFSIENYVRHIYYIIEIKMI